MKSVLFFVFFFCLSAAVMAQQKISIEITAGAASSFSNEIREEMATGII